MKAKKHVQESQKLRYCLDGYVGCWIAGGRGQDDTEIKRELHKTFEAANDAEATKRAKNMTNQFLAENSLLDPRKPSVNRGYNYSFSFSLTKVATVWDFQWNEGKTILKQIQKTEPHVQETVSIDQDVMYTEEGLTALKGRAKQLFKSIFPAMKDRELDLLAEEEIQLVREAMAE